MASAISSSVSIVEKGFRQMGHDDSDRELSGILTE